MLHNDIDANAIIHIALAVAGIGASSNDGAESSHDEIELLKKSNRK